MPETDVDLAIALITYSLPSADEIVASATIWTIEEVEVEILTAEM